MSTTGFNDLLRHVGHNIRVVTYGKDSPINVAIECHTCCEVLLDFDKDEYPYINVHDNEKILRSP